MTQERSRQPFVSMTVLALLIGLGPSMLIAQESGTDDVDGGSKWFPREFAIPALLAAPREVNLGGGLIATSRDSEPGDDYGGTNIEAQVAIGYRLPVIRFQKESPGRPHLVLGFELGTFSRFSTSVSQRDLINTDYKVGIPFSIKYRGWGGRIAFNHQSAHFGDEFLLRFTRVPLDQASLDGFELLFTRDIGPPARAYVGGQLNTRSTMAAEDWVVRFGAEWDPGPSDGRPIRPFAAADFEVNEQSNRIAGRGVAGARFRIERVVLRLEFEGRFGPSEMGRFRDIDESYIGLYLRGEI